MKEKSKKKSSELKSAYVWTNVREPMEFKEYSDP